MKKLLASLGILTLLSLTACGSQPSSTGSPETQQAIQPVEKVTAKPTETPVDTSPKSERGNTIKKLGEASFWRKDGLPDGTKLGQFAVTEIKDVKCTEQFASKPTNGKVIGLTIDLQTFPELAKETSPSVYLTPFDFKFIAPNGTTFNGNLSTVATYSCLDQSLILKSEFGPAEKAHGVLLLDVPTGGGTLVVGKVEWKLP